MRKMHWEDGRKIENAVVGIICMVHFGYTVYSTRRVIIAAV